jgi:hypothetical protein
MKRFLSRLFSSPSGDQAPPARGSAAPGARLRLEVLEDRQLLSITPVQITPAPVRDLGVASTQTTALDGHVLFPQGNEAINRVALTQDGPAATHARHALHGHGRGDYESAFVVPDVGRPYSLHGKVDLAGLGHFEVSGSLHSLGFISHGRAGGELTFSNAKGSLTLQLVGPDQPGFSPLPGAFSYKVVAATGAYHGLHASGVLHLALHQAPGASLAAHGTFTLSL